MMLRSAVNVTFAIVAILLGSLWIIQPGYAQSLIKNDSSESKQGFFDEIVSKAEQEGFSVIVINPAAAGGNSEGDASVSQQELTPEFATLMRIQSEALKFRTTLKRRLKSLPESVPTMIESLKDSSPTDDLKPYLRVLYWSILLLLVGAFIEHQIYIKWFIRKWLSARIKQAPQGYTEKLPLLVSRALLRIIGVLISMLVAYSIGSAVFPGTPPEAIQLSIALLYMAYAACRIAAITWRVILAPYLSQYRIPRISDAHALSLYHWLWITATINILFFTFSVWIGTLGSNSDVDAFLASIFGFVIAMMNTALVIVNRSAIYSALRGGKPANMISTPVQVISGLWLPVSIAYFIFSWLEMSYRLVLEKELAAPLIAGAYAILVSVIVVYGIVNYLIEHVFQRERTVALVNAELQEAEAAEDNLDAVIEPLFETTSHSLNSFEDLARRVASILSLIAGVWALTRIWNVDDVVVYSELVKRSLDVVTILFIGYIIYHMLRIWIDAKIHEEGGDMPALTPGDEGGASGASRLATLLPLFRNFMLAVVAVSVMFSALLELGINVSPLFAGAGVVGLAIGFGAQTLVRDIFSGAFYLFDDAFRKGEYVDIGTVKGTVENISVRSFQLRHHLGPLHTIPFGEIQFLTNYSRDWVMMKLPLRLTYDTDPEQVRKLIKKLGLQLMDDPEIGETFLQPLKSQGVIEMQDSAMIVRVKFMAKPGDQWVIRKRVFQEIRHLFEREGIKFAHREVTVRLAGEPVKNLSAEQRQAVTAAALDDDLEDEIAGNSGDDR